MASTYTCQITARPEHIDILGHVNIATTGIYARSNLEMKRKALEKVAIVPDANDVPFWTEDKDLLSWLEGYGKSL